MPITDKVTLFGYSVSDVEKSVEKFKAEFESKKEELENSISEIQSEIDELKSQIEYEKNNKSVVVKKRIIPSENGGSKEQAEIMQTLYNAHIEATERVLKAQNDISTPLEKRKLLILVRERKANEMKKDLQNLIDYIDSLAKSY
jgi:TolA-binding protein